MPLARSDRRSTWASVSCSSRWTLWRSIRYGVSQWPSTMMARRWTAGTSGAEVLIDRVDLSHELLDALERPLRFRQQLAPEAAREHCRDRQRRAVRGEDVVGSVAGGHRRLGGGADLVERGAEDLGRGFRELGVVLRRRSLQQLADAEKLRSVLDLLRAGRRRQGDLQPAPPQLLEELAHAREGPDARHVHFLVKLGAVPLQRLAEALHFPRVAEVGDEEVAALADLRADDVALHALAEVREGLDPAVGVQIVGINERTVDVEDDS